MSRRSLLSGLGLGAGAALLVSTAPQAHAAGVEVSFTRFHPEPQTR
ncbi:twin-arginine translocation signal domain-containing protein [Actinomyces glycerinitolerans]|nr:twin-arginine translocation signal domain-containing protein [Actinomyces glycerinitolerans]